MKTTVTMHSNDQRVTVTLDAVELSEPRLACELIGEPAVKTSTSDEYSTEAIRLLCFSGMTFARRKLGLPSGICVKVFEVYGVVDKTDEVGICNATSIAIARALQKDERSLLESCCGWFSTDGVAP